LGSFCFFTSRQVKGGPEEKNEHFGPDPFHTYMQTQLGHSSPSVTLNVYARLKKPHDQSGANRLETTIFDTTGSKTVAANEKGATASTVTP
jgi:hypothetical protein